MPDQEVPKQSIEQLTSRYHQLHKKKIQAETNLENAEQRLKDLAREAREKFGTDDLKDLQQMLDRIEEQNEQQRADYQQALDKIDDDLRGVEEEHSAVQDAESDGLS